MSALEAKLESNLVAWAKSQGGTALKGSTNFDTGYPDRVVYLPHAYAHAELKGSSTRYHLNEKQKLWAGRIIASGALYYIIETDKQLEEFKKDVYVKHLDTKGTLYNLNGFNLVMLVDLTTATYEVVSRKHSGVTRLLSGYVSDSIANTIYRIFVTLEQTFPNTNYGDM